MGGGVAPQNDPALDLQRIALAKFRAEQSGDTKLAAQIGKKMNELIKQV